MLTNAESVTPAGDAPAMRASSRSTAARPADSIGIVTVVSGGAHIEANRRSSKPTTLIASGTRTPRSARRRSAPSAMRSL